MFINDRVRKIIFLTPLSLLFIMFFILPIIYIFLGSFFRWDGIGDAAYIGLNNYKLLLKDPSFIKALRNSIIWGSVGAFIQVPLSLIISLILARKPRGWKFFRTVYFMPQVISSIAIATLWAAIYNSEYGIINGFLDKLGLGYFKRNWLGDLKTALPSVILFGVFYIGYYMVIILGSIATIPNSIYEAASIDGASKIKQDIYITIPLIKNSIITCMILAMIFGIRQFDQVYLLTNGGPSDKTYVLVLYLYKQMQQNSYGLANATAMVVILTGVVIINLFRIMLKERE